jgi:hypothetical protein
MPKKISYKTVSEKQTTIIQTLNYDYNTLKNNYNILNDKFTVIEQNQNKLII